jgi:peptidyl-prolyl cis-trans isomerase C
MMNHRNDILLSASMVLALLVSGLTFAQPGAAAERAQVIAVVNGVELTQADFIAFVNTRIGEQARHVKLNQQQLSILLSEYINRELIYQDAVKQGIENAPEVATAIANQRRNIIASFAVRQLVEQPIPNEELERVYKQLMAKPTREYRARHILLGSEQRARELISALEKGEAFDRLAKENSMDATAEQGGELGWVSSEQMAEPLRAAMADMRKGSWSRSPVKSDFGWHILRVEDTRIIPPPPFEEVKDELVRRLHNRNISEHIAKLRNSSEIEIRQSQ